MSDSEQVPFLDLSRRAAGLEPELSAAVARAIASGRYLLGPETEAFEAELAAWSGRRHAVAVASGTEALRLTFLALGIGAGDEVIVPAMTAVPTAAAVCAVGAVPVPVDVDPETAGIDPAAAARARTDRTRAVVPVHLYGRPAELPDLEVPIVEDAAQAHGALDARARSAAAAYSFYPTKNLGTIGDGGALTTQDSDLAAKVKALRHHGQSQPNVFPTVGYNYRLDTLKAAVLQIKLAHLDRWNQRRREIAERYRSRLEGSEFVFQSQVSGSVPVYHILAARHPRQRAVQETLSAAGIGWGKHIVPPAHRQPDYRHLARTGASLPVSESLSNSLVSLPVFPELTNEQVDYVADVLSKVEVSV